jgi:hypothetical protein
MPQYPAILFTGRASAKIAQLANATTLPSKRLPPAQPTLTSVDQLTLQTTKRPFNGM